LAQALLPFASDAMLALISLTVGAFGFNYAPVAYPQTVPLETVQAQPGALRGYSVVASAPTAAPASDFGALPLAAALGGAAVAALAVAGRRTARPARVPRVPRASAPVMETQADLQTLAKDLNPAVGFYDPLKLSEGEFWGQSNEATIGFLRHAEIKHGRVAMAGFVGFIVHANGIHFPWKIPGDELCGNVSAPELWYNLPYAAKVQIITAIGIFEWWSEIRSDGESHYMRGGKPGYFPPFNSKSGMSIPHPVPFNLYDPFNLNKNKSDEWKAKRLTAEINNGRLAMIGLMGFLSESAIPGSVPALKGVLPQASNLENVMSLDFALHGFQ